MPRRSPGPATAPTARRYRSLGNEHLVEGACRPGRVSRQADLALDGLVGHVEELGRRDDGHRRTTTGRRSVPS